MIRINKWVLRFLKNISCKWLLAVGQAEGKFVVGSNKIKILCISPIIYVQKNSTTLLDVHNAQGDGMLQDKIH